MKPDQQADTVAQAERQLFFDWTQAENRPANQPVAPRAGHSSEISHATESAVAPCPSTPTGPHDSQQPPSQAETSSREAEQLEGFGYPPNHPWRYIRAGDDAPPVPFDDIPPAEDYDGSVERDLPKPAAKRIVKARQILEAERRDLEQARLHYEDVIACGAEALSRYDREIAYGGNDELARAGTLALLYNQIAWRKGRIAYLEQLQSRPLARTR